MAMLPQAHHYLLFKNKLLSFLGPKMAAETHYCSKAVLAM